MGRKKDISIIYFGAIGAIIGYLLLLYTDNFSPEALAVIPTFGIFGILIKIGLDEFK